MCGSTIRELNNAGTIAHNNISHNAPGTAHTKIDFPVATPVGGATRLPAGEGEFQSAAPTPSSELTEEHQNSQTATVDEDSIRSMFD